MAMATPFCSSVPIDLIAPSLDDDNTLAQIQQKEAYLSLIDIIGGLAHTT
jgi:hypothetical protein